MEVVIKRQFLERWETYFPGAELPIVLRYADEAPPSGEKISGFGSHPCVPPDVLSFAVPWPKFAAMVDQMEESFLITSSWFKVRARI